MGNRKVKPLPKPTKKLYQCFDLSFYHDGRTEDKPKPVDISFSELLLNPEEGCLIRIRSNLKIDSIAKIMRDNGIDLFPTCDGAMNYARIWNRRATYLCDESGGDPKDHKTWVWYVIDNTVPNNKVIQRINRDTYPRQLTFSEADKIIFSMKFEFDGLFADLLEALKKEGFIVKDS